jgi:tRNA modification GTPase
LSNDTIFALSSGAPPAAIAVVRISGPGAGAALRLLSGGSCPDPRTAKLARLRDPADGALLDQALILWFPGPGSATGEDLAELHLHGGRSVVAAVSAALARLPGLRPARQGEFTRRAFENGRIDLAEAEGLADLLAAETEAQRRNALALAGGALSRDCERWQRALLDVSARIEALLDFSAEADVAAEAEASDRAVATALSIREEIRARLGRPSSERLRDGVRVVLAGPPNAGKSTLLNALAEREAAITASLPGTTRDLIEAPVAIGGVPFVLVDTAGLREGAEEIERIGVERARTAVGGADIILWLGPPEECSDRARSLIVHPRCDAPGRSLAPEGVDVVLSARTGQGVAELIALLSTRAAKLLPAENEVALNLRQRAALAECADALAMIGDGGELVLAGEGLRLARAALDALTGRAGVEDMLDALFGRFCIGK